MTPSLETDTTMSAGEAAVRGAVLSALLFLPALICFQRGIVDEPDVWWHLKAGEWILANRAWPTVDSFSSWGSGQPWTAYSWLPELMLVGFYRALGLPGLVLYTAMLSVGIVAALWAMIGRLNSNLTTTVALTLAGTLGLILLETPRPWLFSILFFVVELDLLLAAGRSGNRRLLWWLVPLFALWANMHIQFVLGLAVLGAAVAESVLIRVWPVPMADDNSRRIGPAWMLLVFTASTAATLVNPYHYHLYEVALKLVGQSGLWNVIQELRAMPFRSVADWTVLGVVVAAVFALGWRRRARLLLVLLLGVGVYLSFRSRRDAWFVLVVGLAVLAYVAPKADAVRAAAPRWMKWAVGTAVAILVLAGALLVDRSKLEEKVAVYFPEEAARFIRTHGCEGPMFNCFTWGGYLIYHLPELPVSIDGRTMVHGESRVLRHADTLRGRPNWRDDPELREARLVLLPRDAALAALLRLDGRFRLVHEDAVAALFYATQNEVAQEDTR